MLETAPTSPSLDPDWNQLIQQWHSYNAEMLLRMFIDEGSLIKLPSSLYEALGYPLTLSSSLGMDWAFREAVQAIESIIYKLDLYANPEDLMRPTPDQWNDSEPMEATNTNRATRASQDAERPDSQTDRSFKTRSHPQVDNRKVFVVHGSDHGVRDAVALVITKLGLEPIILSDMENEGRTIIEKFEHHANVGFAVVLLTADDVGGRTEETLATRARQNVILELGYFVGRLGRSKVCPLYRHGVEIPSDILGVGYISLDASGKWKYDLAKELRAAGYNVDMNRI